MTVNAASVPNSPFLRERAMVTPSAARTAAHDAHGVQERGRSAGADAASAAGGARLLLLLIGQYAPKDLADDGFGQRVPELDELGDLVPGQPELRVLQPLADL